ncbi:unnamed protein product, partial [Durusdinium trenchii]
GDDGPEKDKLLEQEARHNRDKRLKRFLAAGGSRKATTDKARGLLTEWPDALPQRRDKRTTAWKEEDMKAAAGREHYDRLAEAAADRLLAQLPSPSSEDLKEPSEVAAETEPEARQRQIED